MSSIQNDYSSNRRSIEDLEKDYEAAKKKMKDSTANLESRMERNQKEILAKNVESTKATLDEARDHFERSAKAGKREMNELREAHAKQNYDRQGRVREAERENQMTLENTIASADARVKSTEEKLKQFEKFSEERANDHERATQARLEKFQNSFQEDAVSNASTGTKARNDQMRSFEQKVSGEATEAIARARSEAMESQKRAAEISKDYESRMRTAKEKYQSDADVRTARVQAGYEEKSEKSANAERESREREAGLLRRQVKDYSTERKDIAKAKADSRAEVIQEQENEYRYKMELVERTGAQERTKLKQQLSTQEDVLDERFQDALRTQNQKHTEATRRLNAEYAESLRNLKKDHDRAMKDYKGANSNDAQVLQKTYEQNRDALLQQHEKALAKQGEAFRNAFSATTQANRADTMRLEQELRDLKTTQDPSKVSPGVENAIRNRLEGEYSKAFDTEAQRNRVNADRIQESYAERMRDLQAENARKIVTSKREDMADKQALQNQLTSQIEDVEYSKQLAVNQVTESAQRSSDQSSKNTARSLNAQRLHYEEAMAARDSANEQNTRSVLQDTEFEKRQLRREFQTQMNLTVRSYEKKLADQKDDYEEKLREVKDKSAFVNREADKRLNTMMAEQAKTYERRLAEQESMMKQREKLQEKIYEDELDKVKRSNALLLSKKS